MYAADPWAAPGHPLPATPNFLFPQVTGWDEFLHRYYRPVADAGEDQEILLGEAGALVAFDGSGSSDADGTITRWIWDFDAGLNSDAGDWDKDGVDEADDDRDGEGLNAIHLYTTEGIYTVTLIVWDDHHTRGGHGNHFKVDTDTAQVIVWRPETVTKTPTTTPTSSPSPTPTATATATPTATPTTTPTAKPVLTGISSTFSAETAEGNHFAQMRITPLREDVDAIIYDVEIFLNRQDPPWTSALGAAAPEGWTWEAIDGGLRFVTADSPLR